MAAQNISNITTPGYKRRISFAKVLGAETPSSEQISGQMAPDFSAGKLTSTGNPSDLAIAGRGFFMVGAPGHPLYTRQGQFQRDADGRLVTAQGFPVQAQGGGDIVLKSADFKVLEDGSVLEDGAPVAKLAIVDFANPQAVTYAEGGMFSAPDAEVSQAEAPLLRQGMLEASNVSMGDEMVSMMEALRRAETGQRLVTAYDDLLARVLTTFGQS
ncbi:MAG: flagellar hook basal-body protein [Phenylobacterium sp.]